MGQKLAKCCKCKKVFSFSTRFLPRVERLEAGRRETKVFNITCLHCGADNKVEVEI